MKRLAPALFATAALAGCATAPMAMAQPPAMEPHMMPPASAIQPETTINLTGIGKVDHAPDTAMISPDEGAQAFEAQGYEPWRYERARPRDFGDFDWRGPRDDWRRRPGWRRGPRCWWSRNRWGEPVRRCERF